MFGYSCIGFINFVLKGKCLLDYINSFSPKGYKRNDKIKLKCFQLLKTKNFFYE